MAISSYSPHSVAGEMRYQQRVQAIRHDVCGSRSCDVHIQFSAPRYWLLQKAGHAMTNKAKPMNLQLKNFHLMRKAVVTLFLEGLFLDRRSAKAYRRVINLDNPIFCITFR